MACSFLDCYLKTKGYETGSMVFIDRGPGLFGRVSKNK